MRRWLFNLATVVSLVLCVAVGFLWARSYWLTDELEWRSASGFRAIGSASGKIVIQLNPGEQTDPRYYGWGYLRMGVYTAPSYPVAYSHLGPGRTIHTWELGGVGWYTVRDSNGGGTTTGVAPFWLVAAATAVLPLSWTGLRIRALSRGRRRRQTGLCRRCGYDLRATPERCPECGAVPAETRQTV